MGKTILFNPFQTNHQERVFAQGKKQKIISFGKFNIRQ